MGKRNPGMKGSAALYFIECQTVYGMLTIFVPTKGIEQKTRTS